MNRAAALPAALVMLLLALCGLVGVVLIGDPAAACGQPQPSTAPSGGGFEQWNATQVAHATTIVAVGKQRTIPARGWAIALATAMQESTLRNLANNNPKYPLVVAHSLALPHDAVGSDHDSVGLYQQRPNPPEGEGSWGTVAELMTPATAAAKFYAALDRVDGWQSMALTAAAQAVQHSATPNAYTRWEDPANRLAAHVAGVASLDVLGGGPPGAECGAPGEGASIAASGWALPAYGAIVSPYGPRGGAQHNGVDLGAARNAPIYAAAAGTVIVSTCNAPNPPGCDVDGGTNISGCGWYVEIDHGGGITTRYCHMVRAPNVHTGEHVTAGQVIGQVGSSGNSSGPHLHFETHEHVPTGDTGSGADAVEPVAFMAARGVQLGQPARS